MQYFWNNLHVSLLTVVICMIIYVLKSYFSRPKNFPPGPSGFPIFGYLPFLGEEAYLVLHKLRMKYGGIFSVLLGSKRIVVISNYDVMKEAYIKSSLLGRPPVTSFELLFKLEGLGMSSGEKWVENRRFFVNNIRRFNEKLDSAINTELSIFLQVLSQSNGHPCNIHRLLLSSTFNIITSFIGDVRFDYDHPTKILFDDFSEFVAKHVGMISYSLFIPWIKALYTLSFVFDYPLRKKINLALEKFIDTFNIVFESYDGKNIKNISEAFISEIGRSKNKSTSPFTILSYVGTMGTILAAGFDTVSASISWTLLALVTHPEIQRKVQEEIDLVFGKENPNWEDRSRLQYTQAVMMEVQRWRTILPLSGLRCTLADCKIKGYDIPKGTIILLNLWGIHKDPTYWEDPEEFRPERFLTENDLSIKKRKSFSPFSYGKRSCPAEGIAYKEIFLFLTYILQKFDLVWPKSTPPDLEGVTGGGIALIPKPYQLSLVPRKHHH